MVLSALLIAVGILIPIISPIKVILEPMSFTLASHVAIMIAMFVSPFVAVATACGTTLGFLLYGFPMPVVLRAFSHVVWAFAGAYYLKKHPETLNNVWKSLLYMLGVALLHGIDVYKRQMKNCVFRLASCIGIITKQNRRHNHCLLYTSRCV